MVHITLIYAGLLGLLFLGLSFWVVKRRAQFGVMIGQGEAPELLAAIRAHGNFAEYVPLTLLLMALCELSGAGAFLAACRWRHAAGRPHPACHRHPDPQSPQCAPFSGHLAVLARPRPLLAAGPVAGHGGRLKTDAFLCYRATPGGVVFLW